MTPLDHNLDQIVQIHELPTIYADFGTTPKRKEVASICDPIARPEFILELITQIDTWNISKYSKWIWFLLIVCKTFQKKIIQIEIDVMMIAITNSLEEAYRKKEKERNNDRK